MKLRDAIGAGLVYGLVVFSIGFILGAIRTLVVVPRTGVTAAVLAEAPVILYTSWIISRRLIFRFNVADKAASRILMGGIAFAVLMVCELGLSVLIFHRTGGEFFAAFASMPGAIGLVAQVLFAVFPYIRLPRPLQAEGSCNS